MLTLSTNGDMLHVDADLSDQDERSGGRKANKPLMEKRRRARINRSLMELKAMLVEGMKKGTPGHSKWEKADILEMTVQYLQCLKNQRQTGKGDPLAVGQFIAGFSECIRQIQKFGGGKDVGGEQLDDESVTGDNKPCLDTAVRHQLTDFLLSYLKNFSDDATQSFKGDGDHPLHRRASPRLKTVSNSSGGGTSPLSHHSPTGSSLSSPKSVSNMSPLGSDGESPRKSEPKTDDESGGGNSNLNSRENLNSRVFSPTATTHPYRVPLRLPSAVRGGAIHYDTTQASMNSRPSGQDQFQAASAAALLQQMSSLPAFSLVNSSASHLPLAVQHQLQLLGSRPYASLWRPF